MHRWSFSLALVAVLLVPVHLKAQYRADPRPGEQGSSNIRIIGHLPLDATSPSYTP